MLIYGLAAPALRKDHQNQFFEVGALMLAAAGAIGVPLRIKHLPEDEGPDVGEVVDAVAGRDGLFITAAVTDPQIQQWLRDGVLDRFSVAGKLRIIGPRIFGIVIEEVSLTDVAGFPGTKLTIHDADDEPSALDLRRKSTPSLELKLKPRRDRKTKKTT